MIRLYSPGATARWRSYDKHDTNTDTLSTKLICETSAIAPFGHSVNLGEFRLADNFDICLEENKFGFLMFRLFAVGKRGENLTGTWINGNWIKHNT